MSEADDINEEKSFQNLSPEKRREKIRVLKQRGVDNSSIKNIFDISESTLRRDLEEIEHEEVEEVTEVDSEREVGSHILFFKEMLKEAWNNYKDIDIEESPQVKRQFFDALVNVRNRILEIQWETGLIPKDYSSEWLSMSEFSDANSMDDIDMTDLQNMKDDLDEEIEKLNELENMQDKLEDE